MKLKMLKVVFDTEIAPYEIPAFRGAIVEKVGIEHDWFHNHNNEDGEPFNRENKKVFYRYPKVQYKRLHRKPAIIFLQDGIEEAKHFFSKPNWDLSIGGKRHQMPIASLTMNEFDLQETEGYQHYSLYNWMALNSKNVIAYDQAQTLIEKIQLLERILTSGLLSCCKGLGWFLENRLQVDLTDMPHSNLVGYKGLKVRVFKVNFRCNLKLPNHIGIGKGSSKGFGVLGHLRQHHR